MSALFPDIFLEYLIFTLPLWTLIYLWGVPVLLMGGSAEKQTLGQRAKSFVNPMFAGMLLGVLIGLTNMPVPQFIRSAVAAAGSCMSPVAMLLTGMTIAQFNLREVLRIKGELLSWLCGEYNLKPKDIIRHYDVTGKLCPIYFVKHEEA